MAELPENPGSQGSPAPQSGAPAPPPFQPIAAQYQPVAAPFAAAPQPVAAPATSGGSSAVKIILIIVGVFVVLGMLVVGVIGYIGWRVSRAVHVNSSTGAMTVTTPGGTFSANSTEKFTADELGTDIYPGAQPAKGGMKMHLPGGSMVGANFLTSDSKEQVIAFYQNKFGNDAATMETGDGAVLTVNKSKQETVMMTITQKPNQFDGKTQIYILHTINNKAS